MALPSIPRGSRGGATGTGLAAGRTGTYGVHARCFTLCMTQANAFCARTTGAARGRGLAPPLSPHCAGRAATRRAWPCCLPSEWRILLWRIWCAGASLLPAAVAIIQQCTRLSMRLLVCIVTRRCMCVRFDAAATCCLQQEEPNARQDVRLWNLLECSCVARPASRSAFLLCSCVLCSVMMASTGCGDGFIACCSNVPSCPFMCGRAYRPNRSQRSADSR